MDINILEILKDYGIFSAAITGATSIIAVLLGVAMATSKRLVKKRAKFETKERMKIESTREMIKAIRDFHLVIYKARLAVLNALHSMKSNLSSVTDKNIQNFMDKQLSREQYFIDRDSGYNQIEDLIFLLESDLHINGEDEKMQGEINKIKDILGSIKNFFKHEIKNMTAENARNIVNEMIYEYSSDNKIKNEEIKNIFIKLKEKYVERLN